MTMSSVMDPLLEQVEKIVREVGLFQMKHFRKVSLNAEGLKAVRETVSFVDVESERLLKEGLMALKDGVGFYGEESGQEGSQYLAWVVDPLDGTTNYLSGMDHFSISVGLVEDGKSILGLVHKPSTGESLGAVKGEGCWRLDARHAKGWEIMKKPNVDLPTKEALFMTGFPYRSEDLEGPFFATAPEVLKLGLGIRRSGSAALDLSYLGMGWLQGFWESDLQPYDVAAALLMMEEHGIKATNEIGQPYSMMKDRILVAGLPKVHSDLLKIVAQHYRLG